MKRREFITFVAGAAAWPVSARAQQGERVRRVGVLMPFAKDSPESQARIAAFLKELQRLGWSDGRNLQVEYRWETSDLRKAAAELVALSPDVILVSATQATVPMQQATRTIPVVFAQVADPVSAGLVSSLAKPGGNLTGFTNIDYDIGAKWLELLKEIAPHVKRVGVIRDPTITGSIGQFASVQSASRSFGVEVTALGGQDAKDIERTITDFSRGSNCGLISVATPLTVNNRDLIIGLAARHRLPATYPFRFFVSAGGLICYGPDSIDPYRQAAGYVDRILKGEKPSDLPVQGATKFELLINLKTAKTLGLNVPPSLLGRADEVIE
jgi:putative tryptophan/tyrosine transport system substrate-binding protein